MNFIRKQIKLIKINKQNYVFIFYEYNASSKASIFQIYMD